MKAHLQYLWYVLLHKWYVYRAGVRLGVPRWRLLIHDWSKFLPSEWFPYVEHFYGPRLEGDALRQLQARFNLAWLYHQRRNKHHWQYWTMRLDDQGREITLIPPAMYALEMLADWIGAGNKIREYPTLGECARETVMWYAANGKHMLLRADARQLIEEKLTEAVKTWT